MSGKTVRWQRCSDGITQEPSKVLTCGNYISLWPKKETVRPTHLTLREKQLDFVHEDAVRQKRGLMLRRFTAIALCFSLVGLTTIPAGYLPCCCKRWVKQDARKKAPCCRHAAKLRTESSLFQKIAHLGNEPRQMGPHALAGGTMSEHASCCAGKALKRTCPVCRCLEQMQVVALTGWSMGETDMRVAAEALPTVVVPSVCRPRFLATKQHDDDFSGIVITLQTCSLRC
jgi:hypothetical protein